MIRLPVDPIEAMRQLGRVHRLGPGKYRGTCPSCMEPNSMTVKVTPFGDRPSCRLCLASDVAAALNAIGGRR